MIKAKVLCDSINSNGNRLTTFEIEYPRIIHSELLTHRQLSRNCASSRAIPFDKMLEQLNGIPSRFGAAQKGMQDSGEEHSTPVYGWERYNSWDGEFDVIPVNPEDAWNEAKEHAIYYSKAFKEAGYHKQIYNRLTEPFQMIKAIVSATEYGNFFWLRDDIMADPTIAELARKMKEAYDNSTPQLLKAGEWHLPYIHCDYFGFKEGEVSQHYYLSPDAHISDEISLEDAIKVSAARCAAVSYRNEDYSLEKCLQLYKRLVGDERKHSSALEHQATPMKECVEDYSHGYDPYYLTNIPDYPLSWEEGISHVDRDGNLWSGNLKGFIQHRKTIVGECYEGESK